MDPNLTHPIILNAIVNATLYQPLQPWYSPISDILGKIPGPLIGAFFGVLFGFKINDKNRKDLEAKRKSIFKNLLMHEATESIKLISGVVNLIPVDAWNSIVIREKLLFLKVRQQIYTMLISKYKFITMKQK